MPKRRLLPANPYSKQPEKHEKEFNAELKIRPPDPVVGDSKTDMYVLLRLLAALAPLSLRRVSEFPVLAREQRKQLPAAHSRPSSCRFTLLSQRQDAVHDAQQGRQVDGRRGDRVA